MQGYIDVWKYTYPRHITCRSNLGHFLGGSASYGPGNTVYVKMSGMNCVKYNTHLIINMHLLLTPTEYGTM
jgi:hypothetical protein